MIHFMVIKRSHHYLNKILVCESQFYFMFIGVLVATSDNDLLSNRACGAARYFMTVSDTRGPTYSESGGCHSGTLEEF